MQHDHTTEMDTLFGPEDIGVSLDDWNSALGPRRTCRYCRHVLRTRDSQLTGAGPACLARLGAAVSTSAARARQKRDKRKAALGL